jgi:hypothetical protein
MFIVINMWFEEEATIQNEMNMGNEAVTVYIIKYILACIRSG